jgi:two-component system cell cycle sensor histidine kinase PleC
VHRFPAREPLLTLVPLFWVWKHRPPTTLVEIKFKSPLQVPQDRRVQQARLQIVIDSLTATIIFNPLFTALCIPAFFIAGSPLGPVPASRLIVAEDLQLLSAAVAIFIYRRYRQVTADGTAGVERLLIGSQILFSSVWGVVAFLFWLPGNPVNQIFVVMIMSLVSYAVVFARSVHMRLLVVALLVQGGFLLLRLVLSGEALAQALLPLIFAYTIYLWLMGRGSNRQLGTMIAARFVNEDLAAALRVARDDALHKRYEAETANASKTAFLANMSHELRTPLNAILGFSEIIAHQSMGRDQIERYSDYANDIHVSGAHLLSLINDMLDVAKIESGRMEIEPRWVDPRAVVEAVVRLMSPRALQKRQSLEIECPAGTPLVMADERAFRQMLLNLVSNAVKFTPEGGHVLVICVGLAEGGLEVIVQDDGPGIPEEKLPRVLEPFSQIDNRFDREAGGTGLGLALVDGLMRLHAGKIILKNNPGKGLTATLYFPSTMAMGDARARA